ncbi:PQQ-dependent sugar dehydrogenase [Halomicroarcula limicola]|uniref:PQQ-dependent sugar dehydrogenase n=1 Tax=Haloarcula limicola TaxID=1429915 RepID=A0A8J8C364_9EURY|nr:PQQ-dependent sugar dehydrogenase [Halomicroarcula limicola]MBV0923952.1 PQQ-dependent sugar dehydrogenase [Halomicroarcula limicola]
MNPRNERWTTAPGPSRRDFLRTLGVVGATGALAGCSFGSRDDAAGDGGDGGNGGGGDGGDGATDTPASSGNFFEPGPTVSLEPVATGLVSPTALVTATDGTNRRFVVDQIGKVYVHDADGLRSEPFLDLTDRLVAVGENLPNWVAYDERGLLGLAFHPDFAENGLFYVRYSAPTDDDELDHRERLSEFRAADDGSRGDPDSERILLDLPWARPLHQAGTIEFGPDGYLYAALGDGLNPYNGQDLTDNLKGSVLRIDVDGRTGDLPYGIPEDNPLVGKEGRDEHYAWGLRNPWKMGFSGDDLLVGDVGQATWEEVNVVERGGNYGWPLKEGYHCHDPQVGTSEDGECVVQSDRGESLIDPVLEFPHFDDEGYPVGFAVIGGHVHTGPVEALRDSYVFGVFTSSFTEAAGRLLVAVPQESGRWPIREAQVEGGLDIQILAFGTDGTDSYVLGTRTALADDPLSTEAGVVYRLRA